MQRHGPPAPSDVIGHAVRLQARRGHAPGRWRCPMAVVLRYGAMSSLGEFLGAFDALCPSDRLAPPSAICTLLTLIFQAFNPELENVCLTLPFIPERCPQTGCKRGGVVGVIAAAPSTVALGDSSAPACDGRSGNKGCKRRGLHLGRGGRPALVGATPPTLPCRLCRLGSLCGLPAGLR